MLFEGAIELTVDYIATLITDINKINYQTCIGSHQMGRVRVMYGNRYNLPQ